ncbi:hypothetical protein DL770_011101 [Monosporascus sp. CRB-9-2]|nr:hypothetical protein DL770_011101 [Monosporascus sp. CRB-9-2]
MDEATSSIDDKTERVARGFIRERFKGKTIVGVVHRLGSLVEEDWDSYVLMDGGRVAETGELREGGGEKTKELSRLLDWVWLCLYITINLRPTDASATSNRFEFKIWSVADERWIEHAQDIFSFELVNGKKTKKVPFDNETEEPVFKQTFGKDAW